MSELGSTSTCKEQKEDYGSSKHTAPPMSQLGSAGTAEPLNTPPKSRLGTSGNGEHSKNHDETDDSATPPRSRLGNTGTSQLTRTDYESKRSAAQLNFSPTSALLQLYFNSTSALLPPNGYHRALPWPRPCACSRAHPPSLSGAEVELK